jgi:hypothetical protein
MVVYRTVISTKKNKSFMRSSSGKFTRIQIKVESQKCALRMKQKIIYYNKSTPLGITGFWAFSIIWYSRK